MEKYELYNNREAGQYEYRIGELSPHVEYKMKDGDIYLTHTRVPDELRGKGIGKMLVEDVLQDILDKNLKVVPLCGFAASYMRKHPQWMQLLKKGIQIG